MYFYTVSISTNIHIHTSHSLLQVELWNSNVYFGSTTESPPPLIPLENIQGHVVRQTVTIAGELVWATVPLQRVSTIVVSSYWY